MAVLAIIWPPGSIRVVSLLTEQPRSARIVAGRKWSLKVRRRWHRVRGETWVPRDGLFWRAASVPGCRALQRGFRFLIDSGTSGTVVHYLLDFVLADERRAEVKL